MSYSTPHQPFTVTPARVEQGPVWLICDNRETIVCTAFDAQTADFIANSLNNLRDPLACNPYISAMLAAFRMHLEHEMSEPLLDQPLPIGDVLSDLAHWFGLCTGERALALGPDLLVYLARQNSDLTDHQPVAEAITV